MERLVATLTAFGTEIIGVLVMFIAGIILVRKNKTTLDGKTSGARIVGILLVIIGGLGILLLGFLLSGGWATNAFI